MEAGLKEYGIEYRTAQIETGKNGKPYLADRKDVFFSVAHSGKRAVAAFSELTVGCDTEIIKADRDIERLAERFYTSSEAEEVRRDPESFYRLWTLKESCLKAMGTGLATELSEVAFTREGEYYRYHEYFLISRRRGEYYEAQCVRIPSMSS